MHCQPHAEQYLQFARENRRRLLEEAERQRLLIHVGVYQHSVASKISNWIGGALVRCGQWMQRPSKPYSYTIDGLEPTIQRRIA